MTLPHERERSAVEVLRIVEDIASRKEPRVRTALRQRCVFALRHAPTRREIAERFKDDPDLVYRLQEENKRLREALDDFHDEVCEAYESYDPHPPTKPWATQQQALNACMDAAVKAGKALRQPVLDEPK